MLAGKKSRVAGCWANSSENAFSRNCDSQMEITQQTNKKASLYLIMHSVSNINERFHHFWNLTRGAIGRNEDWIENQWISIVSLLRQRRRRKWRKSLPRLTRRLHFSVDSNSKRNRSWRSFCRVQRRLESVCLVQQQTLCDSMIWSLFRFILIRKRHQNALSRNWLLVFRLAGTKTEFSQNWLPTR